MIVPTCRCASFAAVMLLGVFLSDIAPAKKKHEYEEGLKHPLATPRVMLKPKGCRQHFQIDSCITGVTRAGSCLELFVLAVLDE